MTENCICILVPTFEKNRALAEFTRKKVDEHWPGHPSLFFCGLRDAKEQEDFLPLRDDPVDWMSVVRSAVGDLQARGFRKCYLILDDHAPMDRCHVAHLNGTLPRLLDELGAAFINLHGWGKFRPRSGEMLGARYFFMERAKRQHLWKFALHPGLWDLEALGGILDVLLRKADLQERTCWKFERRAGATDFDLPARWVDAAYRVCGAAMSARRAPRWHAAWRQAELFLLDVLRFAIRIFSGQKARDRFDAHYLGPYHYYDGPYPLFWSGIMKKGRLNADLIFFLRLHRRHAQLAELHRFLAPLSPAP
jgi:hypothetical protein